MHVKEGDLVIWDSRIFHQNLSGFKDTKEERLVQYLCYLPKNNEKNDETQTKMRAECFKNLYNTNHWPYPMKSIPLQPEYYNFYNPNDKIQIDYNSLPKPNLDDLKTEIVKLL